MHTRARLSAYEIWNGQHNYVEQAFVVSYPFAVWAIRYFQTLMHAKISQWTEQKYIVLVCCDLVTRPESSSVPANKYIYTNIYTYNRRRMCWDWTTVDSRMNREFYGISSSHEWSFIFNGHADKTVINEIVTRRHYKWSNMVDFLK